MEIINGVDQGDIAGGDCTDIDGATIDSSIIGGTTPAAGSFTTLTASTDPTDANGVGDRSFNDDRYALESNNLSDLADAATSFGNIKQAATESATGVLERATTGEVVTGTDTGRAVTPAGVTARMEAPGAIGGTTPAGGSFTTLDASGQVQGDLINNHMVSKVTFDILGLMVDPRFLNLQCEDPGIGTMYDVSGQGHDGTYHGSMTSGDRVKKGMGWAIDSDGIDDYVDLGDHNDFSFGDGSNDEDATWFGVIEVVNTASSQVISSKQDTTTGAEAREWYVALTGNEALQLVLRDESASSLCKRETDSSITIGWHSYAITYDGAGGANAMNNVKIYIDGEVVASTATNNGAYVAMENLTASCLIGTLTGSDGAPSVPMQGYGALIGLDGYEWTAMDIRRFHQLCKGLYGI